MHCGICSRKLNAPEDPRSSDCGGDCLQCMADAGDPDALLAILRIEIQEREARIILIHTEHVDILATYNH